MVLKVELLKIFLHLADFILEQDADVVFLAEVSESISVVLDSKLGNKYSYSTYHQKNPHGGHFFYSKHPLGPVDHLKIESNRFSYCFHANVLYRGDSISLFGVHMASNNYKGSKASIRPEEIDGITSFRDYLENIEVASQQRCEEAKKIVIKALEYRKPTIIIGDFNDVSGSSPLNILEDVGFNEAWWEGGFGYGATIHHPFPFRIDHILYNDRFELGDIKKLDGKDMSDHDALVANFLIKS